MANAITSGGGFGFRLPATAYEPEDVAFSLASPAIRNRFHAEAGRVAARVWDASRAKGLDRHGEMLDAISIATYRSRMADIDPVTGRQPYSPMGRARPDAQPLTPVGRKSRTRSLLRWRVDSGGVWFTWAFDRHTGRYWGAILDRHSRGFWQKFMRGWGYVPARDVIGFSKTELEAIRAHMAKWWALRRQRAMRRQRATRGLVMTRQPGLAIPLASRPVGVPKEGGWMEQVFVSGDGIWTEGMRVSTSRDRVGPRTIDSGWFEFRFRPGAGPTPPTPTPRPTPPRPSVPALPALAITRPKRAILPTILPTPARLTPSGLPNTVAAAIRHRGLPVSSDVLRLIADRMNAIRLAGFTLAEVQSRARSEDDSIARIAWRLAWEFLQRGIDPQRVAS